MVRTAKAIATTSKLKKWKYLYGIINEFDENKDQWVWWKWRSMSLMKIKINEFDENKIFRLGCW